MRKAYARLRLRLVVLANLGIVLASLPATHAQEPRAKLRISNAGFTITALPLLAAREGASSRPTAWTWK